MYCANHHAERPGDFWLRIALAVLLLSCAAPTALAVTITDGVGTLEVSGTNGSLVEFSTGGNDDAFATSQFYRTLAMGAEAAMTGQFTTVGVITSVAQTAADTITVQGSVTEFDFEMDYVLNGASLTTNLTFSDTTGSNLNLALFSYQDWDVGLSSNDLLGWDGTTMLLTDPIESRSIEIVATPAIAAEASVFGPLLASLIDASPTTLTDGAGLPFGPGDATFAFEYAVFVPANGDTVITTTYTLVPEPGTGALFFLGLLGLAAGRRVKAWSALRIRH